MPFFGGLEHYIFTLVLITLVFLIGLLVLLSAYLAVAMKLFKQGRSVGLRARRTTTGVGPRETAGPSATEVTKQTATQAKTASSKRAMHIQALKIYTSIFLIYLVAYLMIIASGALQSPWLAYGYYINHTVNPVIYYCFVEKFRNSVKKYWHRLTCSLFV